MKKPTPSILIIGGGVAGLSAAQALSHQDVIVHLVEKDNTLGGHAALWACMATDTCENCGACLSIEMADQVLKQKNVTCHLNTVVETLIKKDHGYEVGLENKETFFVEKIILATGFEPFDPVQINSLHHDSYKNVITTAELNTLLKEETLSEYFHGKPAPKIAFLQCVGSRNRELGKDYCSQVCCKISMRHANKLTHLYPEADITLFHMDLQIIGKETRPLFNTLSKNIELAQGVPAEILENPETKLLTIMTEDKENQAQKNQSRVARAFDLIVLSVGMQPSRNFETTAGLLGATPNSWGFFNTDQAMLSTDVTVAGCAKGPKDILASQQDGRMAAARIIDELGLTLDKQPSIAVFGQGSQADQIARAVASKGYSAYLFGPGTGLSQDPPVKILKNCKIISLGGTAGNFSIFYESPFYKSIGGKKTTLTCTAIIAAHEPVQSQKPIEGLTNTPTSLDALSHIIKTTPKDCPDNIAVLLDYHGPEFKSWARLALDTAIKARALGKNICVIMNKMLVHGASGQRLYDTARQQGVDFLRFEASEDLDIQDSGNGFLIKLKEATLPSIELDLNCDCLVLPPVVLPGTGFKETAALLRQPLDKEGFLQSANTRHRLSRSSRKGIFFAGTGHDEIDPDDLNNEIKDILSEFSSRAFDLPQMDTGVEINQKKCAQCLTCIRICPHGAIVMNEKNRPEIVPDSCFSCHLCVSNCPAYAIESKELSNDRIARKVEKDKIVILACERSAALAAKNLSLPDHVTLIKIPCACRISSDILLKALLNGAAKVIVSGCHEENCRSFDGNRVAENSVKTVLRFPGVEASKIVWEPVAANETAKFKRILSKALE